MDLEILAQPLAPVGKEGGRRREFVVPQKGDGRRGEERRMRWVLRPTMGNDTFYSARAKTPRRCTAADDEY